MSFSLKEIRKSKPVLIMGIINLSPDSFFQRSTATSDKEAVECAERMMEEGADILDLGAESSRPGACTIPESEELRELCGRYPIPISVDTYKPAVVEKMLDQGVQLINDITGLQRYPETAKLVARYQAGIVLMHMKGTPETMQDHPDYDDLIAEVLDFLKNSIAIAKDAGISDDSTIIDPGIGFGKKVEDNLELLRKLKRFKILNRNIMVGISRKSFIGKLLNRQVEDDRLSGSLAAGLLAVQNGATLLRVHDVKETVDAVKMMQMISTSNDREN
ncbi:MAG: dihydropteroate synthase [Nitrospinales bacterium]